MTEQHILNMAQALAAIVDSGRDLAPVKVTPGRYVTIALASGMTGLSVKAIERKIGSGVWLENREYRYAPDGHIMVDTQGVEKWVEKGAALRSEKRASACPSPSTARQ